MQNKGEWGGKELLWFDEIIIFLFIFCRALASSTDRPQHWRNMSRSDWIDPLKGALVELGVSHWPPANVGSPAPSPHSAQVFTASKRLPCKTLSHNPAVLRFLCSASPFLFFGSTSQVTAQLLWFSWRPSVVILSCVQNHQAPVQNAVQPDKWDKISAKIALCYAPAPKRVRLRTYRSVCQWYQRKAI